MLLNSYIFPSTTSSSVDHRGETYILLGEEEACGVEFAGHLEDIKHRGCCIGAGGRVHHTSGLEECCIIRTLGKAGV
jgi:hypothetical protein